MWGGGALKGVGTETTIRGRWGGEERNPSNRRSKKGDTDDGRKVKADAKVAKEGDAIKGVAHNRSGGKRELAGDARLRPAKGVVIRRHWGKTRHHSKVLSKEGNEVRVKRGAVGIAVTKKTWHSQSARTWNPGSM